MGRLLLGYAHDGTMERTRDDIERTEMHYRISGDPIPHVSIQTAFTDDISGTFSKPDNYSYGGLSSKQIITRVNPLLWFSSY